MDRRMTYPCGTLRPEFRPTRRQFVRGLGVVAGLAVFVLGNLAYRFGLSRLWRGRGSTPTREVRK